MGALVSSYLVLCSTPEGIGGGISALPAVTKSDTGCAQRPKASEGESGGLCAAGVLRG